MKLTTKVEFDDCPLKISGVSVGGCDLIGSAEIDTAGKVMSIQLAPASAYDVEIEIFPGHRMFTDIASSIRDHCADQINAWLIELEPYEMDYAGPQSYADEHRLRVHEVL